MPPLIKGLMETDVRGFQGVEEKTYKSNGIVLLAANQNDQFHNLIKMCPGVILVNNVICNACFPIYNRLAHRPNFTKCRSLITIHTPYSED